MDAVVDEVEMAERSATMSIRILKPFSKSDNLCVLNDTADEEEEKAQRSDQTHIPSKLVVSMISILDTCEA